MVGPGVVLVAARSATGMDNTTAKVVPAMDIASVSIIGPTQYCQRVKSGGIISVNITPMAGSPSAILSPSNIPVTQKHARIADPIRTIANRAFRRPCLSLRSSSLICFCGLQEVLMTSMGL